MESKAFYDIGIVAHVSRLRATKILADNVGAAHIAIDGGELGCTANHHRVWRLLAPGATTWSVVLEDDALPVNDFRAQLDSALSAARSAVVSLYLGRGRPPQFQERIEAVTSAATARDVCFIRGTRLLHGVGVAVRTEFVAAMLESITSRACRGVPIDEAISSWARVSGYAVGYTWPSLVDHADGPTVAYHRDGKPRTERRHAWRIGTRERWQSTAIPM